MVGRLFREQSTAFSCYYLQFICVVCAVYFSNLSNWKFRALFQMSFISTLTWSCIELQGHIEDSEVKEEEKSHLILKHLNSVEEKTREVFPEFQPGG